MDQLYRGVETSLLVLSLALVLAVAAVPTFRIGGAPGEMAVTLPPISVAAGESIGPKGGRRLSEKADATR